MLRRRTFVQASLGGIAALVAAKAQAQPAVARGNTGVSLTAALAGEDVFRYLRRTAGGFDATRYKQILGAANAFKEGDQIVGVAAADDGSRGTARALLAATRLDQIDAHPPLDDGLYQLVKQDLDQHAAAKTALFTFAELKQFL